MKIAWKWIQEYIECQPQLQIDDAIQTLEKIGFEIEDIKYNSNADNYAYFRIVTISEIIKHPNADTLNVCKFTEVGHTVVCGGTNLYIGMRTIMAIPGATVYAKKGEKYIIQKTTIRGVDSDGMLCAESEVGLKWPSVSGGIINLLPNEINVIDIIDQYGCILDASMTPNRQDLLHPYGIARELSCFSIGILKGCATPDDIQFIQGVGENYIMKLGLKIQNFQLPRYIKERIMLANLQAKLDAKIQKHQDVWHRLHGDKPDHQHQMRESYDLHALMTYIEYIFGYRLDCISIQSDEYVIVLNDDIQAMNSVDILIDSILGKQDDSAQTTLTYLQKHCHEYQNLFGLKTRYDCFNCIGLLLGVLRHNADVISPHSKSYAINNELLSAINNNFMHLSQYPIVIPYQQCNELNISNEHVMQILSALGFHMINDHLCTQPLWRTDVLTSQDIMEEVTRYIGYDAISEVPISIDQSIASGASLQEYIDIIKSHLRCHGSIEVVNNDFVSTKVAQMLENYPQDIAIDNPMSNSQAYMRSSILATLINTYSEYKRYNWQCKLLFEEGYVYHKTIHNAQLANNNTGNCTQSRHIAMIFDPSAKDMLLQHYMHDEQALYLHAKQIFEQALSVIYGQFDIYTEQDTQDVIIHDKCNYYVRNKDHNTNICIGWFGVIQNAVLRKIKCNADCYAGEIKLFDITDLHNTSKPVAQDLQKCVREPISKNSNHKVLTKDISYEINADIKIDDAVHAFIGALSSDTHARIIDVYPSCNLGIAKTITMRIIWDNLQESMTTDAIKLELDRIYEQLNQFGYRAK